MLSISKWCYNWKRSRNLDWMLGLPGKNVAELARVTLCTIQEQFCLWAHRDRFPGTAWKEFLCKRKPGLHFQVRGHFGGGRGQGWSHLQSDHCGGTWGSADMFGVALWIGISLNSISELFYFSGLLHLQVTENSSSNHPGTKDRDIGFGDWRQQVEPSWGCEDLT